MRTRNRAALVTALAITAALVYIAPAAATTRVVNSGQSIQSAIDASSPGDTVDVKQGTYREFLQISNKDRITLKGEKARLKPPTTAGTSLCNQMGDPTGICITGQVNPPVGSNPPTVVRNALADRVTGFRISGFKSNGIFGFGTRAMRVDHNTFTGNGEYGVFSNTSTATRLDHNVARKNKGEAAFYVGDSPNARSTVDHNRAIDNHGEGLLLRSASRGRVTRNVLDGNCAGIVVLADAPGPAGHWRIDHNVVDANNRACKGNPKEGEPALSGIGIALSGVNHTVVSRNTVRRNRHLHASELSGGILVERAEPHKGSKPKSVAVRRNVVRGNTPNDLHWDGQGTVSFSRNTCGSSKPGGLC
jgi:nitrous oxidase accessory protein NosD